MKTQKRIAYCSCGCAMNLESGDYMDDKGEFHNSTALVCPRCGAAHPGEAFAARCIRKNREARLRNKISDLQQRIQFAEMCIPVLIEEIKKYQRQSMEAIPGTVLVAEVAGNLFLAPCWGAKKKIAYMTAYTNARIRLAEMAIPGLLRYIERLKRGGDGHTLGLVLSDELASLGVAQIFLDLMKSTRRKGGFNEQE